MKTELEKSGLDISPERITGYQSLVASMSLYLIEHHDKEELQANGLDIGQVRTLHYLLGEIADTLREESKA